MEPVFIYFNKSKFDDFQRFTLKFSQNNKLKKLSFSTKK